MRTLNKLRYFNVDLHNHSLVTCNIEVPTHHFPPVIVIVADTSTPFISGTTHVYTPISPDGVPPTMASLTCSVKRTR